MLKTIAVLLLTLSTLLLVNVGQTAESTENYRKPALAGALAEMGRSPAFIDQIEEI